MVLVFLAAACSESSRVPAGEKPGTVPLADGGDVPGQPDGEDAGEKPGDAGSADTSGGAPDGATDSGDAGMDAGSPDAEQADNGGADGPSADDAEEADGEGGEIEDAEAPEAGTGDAEPDAGEELPDCAAEDCPPPVIENLTPNSGGASVETAVVIRGKYFQPGVNVFVGEVPASAVAFSSTTELHAVFPPVEMTAAGLRTVTIINPDGQQAEMIDGFNYYFDEDPIVFVHGFWEQELSWDAMLGHFRDAGYPDTHLWALTYEDSAGSSVTHASIELPAFINQVLAATGAERVDIVCHSMGGLSTRLYIKMFGGQDIVRDYVSLAGAHHGSKMGCVGSMILSEGAREMCPPYAEEDRSRNHVQWILNGDPDTGDVDETPFGREEGGPISYLSVRVPHDEIIVPNDSSCLNQKARGDCSDPVNVSIPEPFMEHALIIREKAVFDVILPHLRAHNSSKP